MTIADLIQMPCVILSVGKTESGKTHMIKYLLKCLAMKGRFNYGCVISSTLFEGEWDCVPEQNRAFPTQARKYICRIIKYQKRWKEQGILMHSFIVLDDCIGAINFNDALWTQIVTTLRHYGVTLFVNTQYYCKLPAVFRSQAGYIFFMKMLNDRELRAAYEGCFPFMKYREFKEFVKERTGDHKCIFVDNKCSSNCTRDMYKIIKAPQYIIPFTLIFNYY